MAVQSSHGRGGYMDTQGSPVSGLATVAVTHVSVHSCDDDHHHHVANQAIASMPSTPRPTGAEGRGSTAPECLQVLRTSQACTPMPKWYGLQGLIIIIIIPSLHKIPSNMH
jgi:hypothetical protein